MKKLDAFALDSGNLVGEMREVAREEARRNRGATVAGSTISAN
jgi:hypothetical protein